MIADRADGRSLLADDDMAAVRALPNHVAVAREDEAFFDVLQQLAVAFFVFLFDFADHFKLTRDFVEAFFTGFLGHLSVHVGPFIIFAVGGSLQVSDGIRNFSAHQILEPDLGVFLFVAGGFFKDVGNLDVAFFASLRRKICVFVARLGFSSESGPQVLFCFRAF